MTEAIKLAIEKGGYKPTGGQMDLVIGHDPQFHGDTVNQTVLDPLFWQALGKALGWTEVCGNCGLTITNFPGRKLIVEPEDCGCGEECNFIQQEWLFYALRYHETNLTGGDTEKFWKELLNGK